jgi:hypothetical protein
MGSIARLLRFFAASLVPGGGYFLAGWSPSTTLALYWVDTLVGGLAMGLRIQLHRRWTGMAGHGRAQIGTQVQSTSSGVTRQVTFRSFLAEFLFTAMAFTIAHGIFLAAILGLALEPPSFEDAQRGAIGILACHGLSLGLDTFRIERWSFAQLKQMVQRALGRVFVVHLTIVGGMAFFAWRGTPDAFFAVFVWLKALFDIGSFVPQWNPREPPRLLVKAMSVLPKQKGETFEEYWRRTHAEEQAQRARDEQRVEG